MTRSKKFAPWLILALLLLWVAFTDSPYQKGGVSPVFTFAVPSIVLLVSVLISLLYGSLRLIERLIISFFMSIATLLVVTLIVTPYVVDFFYNGRTWALWETRDRILINAFYYGLNAILSTLLFHFYHMFRIRPMRSGLVASNLKDH